MIVNTFAAAVAGLTLGLIIGVSYMKWTFKSDDETNENNTEDSDNVQ